MPEDLDYYDGLLGQQPGANKAMRDVEGEGSSTSDYPIPLPSYLLLVLATVASIAFTGSIFEVTGGHPEVSLSERKGGRFYWPLLWNNAHFYAVQRLSYRILYDMIRHDVCIEEAVSTLLL